MKITILTINRFSNLKRSLFYIIKYFILFFQRNYIFDIKSFLSFIKYDGHPQVIESLVNGLKLNKIEYNLNPKKLESIYPIVIVISGIEELKKAIHLKKIEKIKKLIVGPTIAIQPSELGDLLESEQINLIVTASKWMVDFYILDMPSLKGKVLSWPSGTNLEYWINKNISKKEYVLFYVKQHNIKEKFKIKIFTTFLKLRNIKFKIIYYGKYNNKIYRKYLHKSMFSIFFSMSESQGIALLESWAAGCPTLVYYNDRVDYKHYPTRNCETAPYLTNLTGKYFYSYRDFEQKCNYFIKNYKNFNTSKWVSENMTDKISASNLLKMITDTELITKSNRLNKN
tara:strand:+ start:335 stop:1357 length:1023 start_codon:yes stop_codon:yes gene_type:complete